MTARPTATLALLIDGDNVSPDRAATLVGAVAKFGIARVRRLYGDFSTPRFAGWKDRLHEYSIQPMQQFANTPGKNATDIAMIIDAMDLLHTGRFSGFCIASSDGDFTRLATRIREQGVAVYGFGERKTPDSFFNACDRFMYFDEHTIHDENAAIAPVVPNGAETKVVKSAENIATLAILRQAISAHIDDNGWAPLSNVGHYLKQHAPNLIKNSPFSQLHKLLAASGIADVARADGKPAIVRLKSASDRAA